MLALLAGNGRLPEILLDEVPQAVICELDDERTEVGRGREVIRFRLETFGTLVATLRELGVTEICLAGSIRRPRFDPTRVDAATAPLLAPIARALVSGDDAALRAVMGILENEGFVVRAAHELLPHLLPPAGVLTAKVPSDLNRRDAQRGAQVLDVLSAADVGQACVVASGQVVAVEASPGTDWMLASLTTGKHPSGMTAGPAGSKEHPGERMNDVTGPDAAGSPPQSALATGGVLVKAPKRGQDRRADLPVIGPETATGAIRAGLAGIVIEAGGVMILDRAQVLAILDEAGLFLWVRDPAP